MSNKTYLCIDLKSFYASVECVERGLDPFETLLVVADPDRTEKTICLAVTPAMKALGVRNRCRVFEIPPGIDYIKAKPRMRLYMQRSAEIYAVYLRYISPDDMHVYSIDEVFIDATPYLTLYRTDARSFARKLMDEVKRETGVCATAGIGTNLFLAKVALDLTAKHAPDNIGFLDEDAFKREVWFHQPITDIWQIGPGIARRLAKYGARDLAGVAAMNSKTLYKEFGKNAEYLIDHAWGQEPCSIAEIHRYVPEGHSMVNGQVLSCDYSFDEARMVLREMAESSILELVEKGFAAGRVSLRVGYAKETVRAVEGFCGPRGSQGASESARSSRGISEADRSWGPWSGGHTGGSRKLSSPTNSRHRLLERFEELYDETTLRDVPIRRLMLGFADLARDDAVQRTLFDEVDADGHERSLQKAVSAVHGKFGRNALLRAASLQEKATARERNDQVGGHHA